MEAESGVKNSESQGQRSVMFVSYAYPPISSPGAVRVVRLIERMTAHGISPTVLTVDGGYSKRSGGLDDPLKESPERCIRVSDPLNRGIQRVRNAAVSYTHLTLPTKA